MQEVKKEVKTSKNFTNFYLLILEEIKNNQSPKGICLKYNISKQKLQYYLNFLKNKGFINKVGYATWEIKEKGKNLEEVKKEVKKRSKKISLGVKIDKPITNLHALQIKIPIISGKIRDKDWEIKNKLKNWLPKYKNLNNLGGLTIRNNNNKSLTVFAKSRDIRSLEEVDNLSFKIRAFIYDYFRKEDVLLDIFNCEVKNIDLETQDKDIDQVVRRNEKFTLDLNKKSEKIFEKDDINAKSWIDPTPIPPSVGTNDKEWKREYLSMPFRLRDMFSVMQGTLETLKVQSESLKLQTENTKYLADNISYHLPYWFKMGKNTEQIAKLLKKLDNKLSQTNLNRWF